MITFLRKPKDITEKEAFDSCLGLMDNYGKPFRVYNLVWPANKQCASGTRVYGCESTFVTFTGTGVDIKHGTGEVEGFLVFMPDRITGQFMAKIADTKKNRDFLADHWYDNMWTIREEEFRKEIEVSAPIHRNKLKEVMVALIDDKGEPLLDENGEPKFTNMYERKFGKDKRLSNAPAVIVPKEEKKSVESEGAEVAAMRIELQKMKDFYSDEMRKMRTEMEEFNRVKNSMKEQGLIEPDFDYPESDLQAINSLTTLRKIAVEKFNLSKNDSVDMDKKAVIEYIMEKQREIASVVNPETVE